MKKSNINRFRFIFFEVGMILALSFALMAFKIEGYDRVVLSEEIEETEITIYSAPPTIQPKEKKPKVEKVKKTKVDEFLRNIKLVRNNVRLPDVKPKKEPAKILHASTQFISHMVVKPNAIEMAPDVNPEFPGGESELMQYLQKHVIYPDIAEMHDREGVVWVSFVVDEEGNISEIKVLKDEPGFGCGDEAVRVIRKMPRWKPGVKNGKNVKTRFVQSIRFELSF